MIPQKLLRFLVGIKTQSEKNRVWCVFDVYKWLSSNVLFGFLRNARHWTNSSTRSLSLVINV